MFVRPPANQLMLTGPLLMWKLAWCRASALKGVSQWKVCAISDQNPACVDISGVYCGVLQVNQVGKAVFHAKHSICPFRAWQPHFANTRHQHDGNLGNAITHKRARHAIDEELYDDKRRNCA